MKMRYIIETASGSTYIWSPGREKFWRADGEFVVTEAEFQPFQYPTVGERCVVRGTMWDESRRCWVEGSKLTTNVVTSIIYEDDPTCMGGFILGPINLSNIPVAAG